jgi:hypothetical protein
MVAKVSLSNFRRCHGSVFLCRAIRGLQEVALDDIQTTFDVSAVGGTDTTRTIGDL